MHFVTYLNSVFYNNESDDTCDPHKSDSEGHTPNSSTATSGNNQISMF